MKYDKIPDIDLLIKCALDAGATISKSSNGEVGIYINGKKLTDDNLEDCLFNPASPTNGDLVRSMTNEEISKWFWWMLNKTREYTDSRIALKEWLYEEANLNDLPFKRSSSIP